MKIKNESNTSQCQRLLKHLSKGALTTFEIRHKLDIVAPAARVWQLKHEQGYNIQTLWDTGKNPGGSRHRIARYLLLSGKYKETKRDAI